MCTYPLQDAPRVYKASSKRTILDRKLFLSSPFYLFLSFFMEWGSHAFRLGNVACCCLCCSPISSAQLLVFLSLSFLVCQERVFQDSLSLAPHTLSKISFLCVCLVSSASTSPFDSSFHVEMFVSIDENTGVTLFFCFLSNASYPLISWPLVSARWRNDSSLSRQLTVNEMVIIFPFLIHLGPGGCQVSLWNPGWPWTHGNSSASVYSV